MAAPRRPVRGRNTSTPPVPVWPEDEPGLPPLDGVVAALDGFHGVGDRSPLEVELLVSEFLGQLGAGQAPPPPGEPDHVELLNGIVEICLHHLDEAPPRVVLDFLWVIDAFEPGWVQWPLRERLAGSPLPARPAWAMDVGQSELRSAHRIAHETGDGFDVAVVARHRSSDRDHVVAVYVDRTLGGMATDLLVHGDADEYLRLSRNAPGMTIDDVDLAAAAATIDEAVDATFDAGVPPAVADGFSPQWAVVEHHVARCPPGGTPLAPTPAPSAAAQQDVVDRFLAEVDGTDPADRELLLEATAFIAEQLGGDPIRWSPAVTQMVLGGWAPLAGLAPDVAARLPAVLRRLLPWAHEQQGWGERHLADALAVVDAAESGELPTVGEPGRVEILEQAAAEGVDLDDEAALDAFLDRYLDEHG